MITMLRGAARTFKHVVILALAAFCLGLGIFVGRELTVEALLFATGLSAGVVVGSMTTAITCRLARKSISATPMVLPEGFVFLPGQAPVSDWPSKQDAGA